MACASSVDLGDGPPKLRPADAWSEPCKWRRHFAFPRPKRTFRRVSPASDHVVAGQPAHHRPADEDGQPAGQHLVEQHRRNCDGRRHAECRQPADQRGSTAPTPPGVGAAEARVPPTIVTTVTVTNETSPPNALVAGPTGQCGTQSGCRTAQYDESEPLVRGPPRPGRPAPPLSLGRTEVPSQRRSLGTIRTR